MSVRPQASPESSPPGPGGSRGAVLDSGAAPSPGLGAWEDHFTLISSPRRLMWAFQAAWRGEDILGTIRRKIARHRLDEIHLTRRSNGTTLFRLADSAADLDVESPLDLATRRYRSRPALPTQQEAPELHLFEIVGNECQLRARVLGSPPEHFRELLQNVCDEVDDILREPFISESEVTRRLSDLLLPLLPPRDPVPTTRVWTLLNICLMLFVGIVALLTTAGVQHYRWQQMVVQIDAAPGIEVISQVNKWGRRRLDVLRDPLSPPLVTVLQSVGLEPHQLEVRERPFVSGEPLFVARRAHLQASHNLPVGTDFPPLLDASAQPAAQARNDARIDLVRALMELPPDLKLTLQDDRLTAVGTLTEPTYTRLSHAPRRISWLRSVDVTQVRDLTGENIANLKDGIEKTPIEFLPSSSILPEATKLRLHSVGSEMRLLADEANLKKLQVRLQIQANHPDVDPLVLARRLELLTRELGRLGMPASWFQPSSGLLDAPSPNSVRLRLSMLPPDSAP